MDLGLRAKRAAVAASSAGLGLATARALVEEGAQVAICGRDPERLRAAAAGLGPDVVAIEADLARADEAERFVAEASDRLGGLDILVANAGGPPSGSATATSLAAYQEAIDVNLMASVAMCLAAVPQMRERRWGRILAITSVGVRQPIPFLAASVTARAGLTGFLKTLAIEVAGEGVTVNSIQPGSHVTDRLRNLHGDQLDALAADIPTGTLGDPDDFGAVAAFLCSERAAFITGTSVLVDGGASRGLM